ncbi:MAG: hypothetical protein P8Z75_03160 [Gammaproteobacteria bacterium]|jgi:hypothetical protein
MILYTIMLFSLAVLVGMYMIYVGLRYRRGSLVLGVSHAGIASTALVLLIVYLFHNPGHSIIYNDAALVFVMTLAGGLVLLALREGRRPPPMVVVGVHVVMALFGLLLLVVGYHQP